MRSAYSRAAATAARRDRPAEQRAGVTRNVFQGSWRIIEADRWDADYLDMIEPATLRIGADRSGTIILGCITGEIDYRVSDRTGRPTLDFSWEGSDEGTPISGRGWGTLDDGLLRARLYIHHGDETDLVAEQVRPAGRRPARRRSSRR